MAKTKQKIAKEKKVAKDSMDELLKMSPQLFSDVMHSQNVGYLSSLKNLITLQYVQCEKLKGSLLLVLEKHNNEVPEANLMPEKDKQEYRDKITELYLVMQLLEDRYNILEEIIKEKQIVK